MTASITVHEWDGTQVGSALAVSRTGTQWRDRAGDDGTATVRIPGPLITAAQLADDLTLRVNDGTSDVFEFVLGKPLRRLVDAGTLTTELEITGPGTRWLLHAGQVRREDTSECAPPSRERWFGWMSGAYDDAAWTAPASHGRWRDDPFESPRPEGFPATAAEYLWRTTDYDLGEEDCLFRQTFSVAEEQDVVLCISADDEFECWLDGARLPLGSYGSGQLYQWGDFDQYAIRLCAGEHTFAVRGRNLPANVAGQNPGWVIWAFCEAAGDGQPAAQNDVHTITSDATGGTWTIRIGTSDTTSTVDWNESTSDLQAELEGQVGAGNVTVSGSPGAWVIEMVGERANTFTVMQVDGTNLTGGTITKDHTQYGHSASTVAYSTTDTAVHYDPSGGEPGMTIGEILILALEEVRDRGDTVFDHISEGFTATHDSDGVAWADLHNLPVSLPADVHRLVELIDDAGTDVWMGIGLVLEASQERGDNTAVSLSVPSPSTGNLEAYEDRTGLENVIDVRAANGVGEVADTASIAARGRWESAIDLGDFDSLAAARPIAESILDDTATPPRVSRWTVPSEANVVPYQDYAIGDRIDAPVFTDSGFTVVTVRVDTIEGTIVDGAIDFAVEVVD